MQAAAPERRDALMADAVEVAAAEIRAVERTDALQNALAVGKIVFHRIFRGDVELVHRNGRKDISFSRLASCKLGMSRASLWRAVRIYELSQHAPILRESKHLNLSHVRAVLGLPRASQQQLLARAERQRLDVAAVVSEAAAKRDGAVASGRPKKAPALRAIETLWSVAALPVDLFSDDEALAKADVEGVAEMLDELQARMKRLRRLAKARTRRHRA
jgi:hypothetical protein